MSRNLSGLVDSFTELRVLVIGEAMLDIYLDGSTDRLCREAPVPVVDVTERRESPGGAANVAVNVCSLGADAHFLSVIGDDAEGVLLRHALQGRGVSTEHLLVAPDRRTLAKHRVLAGSQMLVRFDQGSTDLLSPEGEQQLIARLVDLYPCCDAIIVSDYAYGVLTPAVRRTLSDLNERYRRVLVTDSKSLEMYREVGVTAVKPNYGETVKLLGLPKLEGADERVDQVLAHGTEVLEVTGAQIAAVTLDTSGAVIFERDRPPYRTYARPRPHSHAAGAGDTFASTLTLALAAGGDMPAAAELAAAAAEIVVDKDGTASCSTRELHRFLLAEAKLLGDLAQLEACVAFLREQGHRIVFTNGCFDILHRGHITYLSQAKALGNVLIVGLNSDESVRRLKGERRPINTLEDRVQVLAALSCVDYVVPFEEDTPEALLRVTRPDIFVKGGDYTRETLPEVALVEALGGTIEILPYLEDRSTTDLIERICEVYAVPAGETEIDQGKE